MKGTEMEETTVYKPIRIEESFNAMLRVIAEKQNRSMSATAEVLILEAYQRLQQQAKEQQPVQVSE